MCCAFFGLNNKLFKLLQLVLSTVPVLAEYCIFLPKHFGMLSLPFISIWCGTFGWYNKSMRSSKMHGMDNFTIIAPLILVA
jgi:hypothetical protein